MQSTVVETALRAFNMSICAIRPLPLAVGRATKRHTGQTSNSAHKVNRSRSLYLFVCLLSPEFARPHISFHCVPPDLNIQAWTARLVPTLTQRRFFSQGICNGDVLPFACAKFHERSSVTRFFELHAMYTQLHTMNIDSN